MSIGDPSATGPGVAACRNPSTSRSHVRIVRSDRTLESLDAQGLVLGIERGQEYEQIHGRLGTGEDVGHACVYLASDEASWLTGQTIGLNGGSLTS